jgi:hypothetical protein
MKKLRVGQRFYGKFVGAATTSASGAYTIRVSNPAAITSSEYYGNVNLVVEAAGHGYVSLYGVPRKVTDGEQGWSQCSGRRQPAPHVPR